jgi:hypothetical protein
VVEDEGPLPAAAFLSPAAAQAPLQRPGRRRAGARRLLHPTAPRLPPRPPPLRYLRRICDHSSPHVCFSAYSICCSVLPSGYGSEERAPVVISTVRFSIHHLLCEDVH